MRNRVLMDFIAARKRFSFLAEAFSGEGGFAPVVQWEDQQVTIPGTNGAADTQAVRRVPKVAGPCNLVPYPRESPEKFASRAAVAVYENHLREACERFTGFLGRRRPMRSNTEAPLVQAMIEDADMRGTSLDLFLQGFALQAKARGTMLLLMDMPVVDDSAPASLQQQIAERFVPMLHAVTPESVVSISVDSKTGQVLSAALQTEANVDGKLTECELHLDSEQWVLKHGDRVLGTDLHHFGQCPLLIFSESNQPFPHVGKYAQIADLSLRVFNANSELDEILRGQTFSLLTMQVPADAAHNFNPAQVAATIGTHSLLVHQGLTPAFVAPDSGPAEVYLARIEALTNSIKRIAQDDATTTGASRAAESGAARKMRFERLNADLASFSQCMQGLEQRMWELFHRRLAIDQRITVEWPTDFNLVDTQAELDILLAMQTTAFPPQVLAAKRQSIASAEFDGADDTTKTAISRAINEQAQQ